MDNMIRKICYIVLLLLGHLLNAAAPVFGQGNEVSPDGAWCWFADPRAIHHENPKKKIKKTYIGYIDVHGNIKAMQYDFVKNEQVEVLVRSWFQPDDHNNPTFLVLPDDRVMVFYSRHTDERCFYYRISQKPGDITTLGKERRLETDHHTTYPSPFILADDPEHFYLCWRGLNWHPTIARLSLPDAADNVTFVVEPRQIVQSTGSRPYAKYVSNGKDKIYIAYTTGHPDNENPNFLYFSYVDINSLTLHDVQGTELAKIEERAFRVNKTDVYIQEFPTTVVDNPQQRDWVWQVAIDKDSSPVIAFVRISEDKRSHEYYYAKWTGMEWKKTFLANGGGHFHQTENLEMCYSGGMTIDPDKVSEVYCSVPVDGTHGAVYELIKYTLDDAGYILSTEAITSNSPKNNIRPYMIEGSLGTPLRLTWMHGDYYDWIVSKSRPGYPTAIHSDFEGMNTAVDLAKGFVSEENSFQDKLGKRFTISLDVVTDTTNYEGTLFQIGDLSYQLDRNSLKPQVEFKGTIYPSTNILGSADSWRKYNRGTSGKWYAPEKLQRFKLTLTYEKGILYTYVNGLLDQYIVIGKINQPAVKWTSPNDWVRSIYVYNRVLNNQEITALH